MSSISKCVFYLDERDSFRVASKFFTIILNLSFLENVLLVETNIGTDDLETLAPILVAMKF